jgi:hypothetical protein
MALPDFFIVGAPKAGTTALHAALATHPQLYLSKVKEPKFFLTDGGPQVSTRGPGDAHGAKETIWQREQYEALFSGASPGMLRGESSAFYLQDPTALGRIHRAIPEAKLIAVLRDPVDRAYSNWLHLWADGLEPIGDFVTAFEAEDERIAAGWGFFWHYRRLGLYGEQLQRLLEVFDRKQLCVLRYRELVDQPAATLDRICDFLGVDHHEAGTMPPENMRRYVPPSAKTRVISPVVRSGARLGAHLPPQVWRKASVPLIWALQRGGGPRPSLPIDARRRLVAEFSADIALLDEVAGGSYSDWLTDNGRGEFASRRADETAPINS